MIKKFISKTLPFVAAAALLYPAIRKLADATWREELTTTYQIGDQNFGGWFFMMVGLLEAAIAGLILWPKTRVPAGLAMAGFFVGALVFNLGLRVDQDLLPVDRPTLSTLIPLDISHLLIGLAVAWLWRSAGKPTHLWVIAKAAHSQRTHSTSPKRKQTHSIETKVYTDKAGLALQGHDPVAYFTVGAPTEGNPNISREWSGATWLFSTAEHRDLFDANPDKYAPAFGGHCAVGQILGSDLRGSAQRWRIKNDRLYLNKNLPASLMFGLLAGRIKQLDERP